MITDVPIFWLFDLICLFSSRIIVNITEFDKTVIKRGGAFSAIKRFNQPFSTFENACSKSGMWQFLSIRFLCVLSFDFAMWLWTFRLDFPLNSVFLWFYFFRVRTILTIWNVKFLSLIYVVNQKGSQFFFFNFYFDVCMLG